MSFEIAGIFCCVGWSWASRFYNSRRWRWRTLRRDTTVWWVGLHRGAWFSRSTWSTGASRPIQSIWSLIRLSGRSSRRTQAAWATAARNGDRAILVRQSPRCVDFVVATAVTVPEHIRDDDDQCNRSFFSLIVIWNKMHFKIRNCYGWEKCCEHTTLIIYLLMDQQLQTFLNFIIYFLKKRK